MTAQSYWGNLVVAFRTLAGGLGLTWKHFTAARHQRTSVNIREAAYFEGQRGIATVQYPREQIPVPDQGRYQLHNEIDDCIVCDKCAKICPVDCIDIEPIKSPEEFGKTADGTPKRIYAAKFDIDMAKCCFCGLCTTVCPTECLTMTKVYDFSTFDITDHNFAFGTMTLADIAAKKQAWEEHQKAKTTVAPASPAGTPTAKPVFKPRIPPAKPQ